MELFLLRIYKDEDSTIGSLFVNTNLECFTLEDEYREVKVPGETRIPSGIYEIKLRAAGGMHLRYSKKYPWHEGMLWLQNVPNFEYIYIHIGNYERDTEGCILVGTTATGGSDINCKVSNSVQAYERLYKKVLAALKKGEKVHIKIKELII